MVTLCLYADDDHIYYIDDISDYLIHYLGISDLIQYSRTNIKLCLNLNNVYMKFKIWKLQKDFVSLY